MTLKVTKKYKVLQIHLVSFMVKSLKNLSIRWQEMTHCDKCVHGAYTNVYRSIAMEHG